MATFSYTPGSTADRDRVRLEIGDTVASRALFVNDELDDILVQEGTVLAASARACEILAIRYAREFDFTADGGSFKKSQVSENYKELAKKLRTRSGPDITIPIPVDGHSDDIQIDDVTTETGITWDRGRYEE